MLYWFLQSDQAFLTKLTMVIVVGWWISLSSLVSYTQAASAFIQHLCWRCRPLEVTMYLSREIGNRRKLWLVIVVDFRHCFTGVGDALPWWCIAMVMLTKVTQPCYSAVTSNLQRSVSYHWCTVQLKYSLCWLLHTLPLLSWHCALDCCHVYTHAYLRELLSQRWAKSIIFESNGFRAICSLKLFDMSM